MQNCPVCREKLLDNVARCKYCGAKLQRAKILARERDAHRATVKFFVVGLLFLAALGGLVYWQSGTSARKHEEYQAGYRQGIQAGADLATRVTARPTDADMVQLIDTEYTRIRGGLENPTRDFEQGWKEGAKSALLSRSRHKFGYRGLQGAAQDHGPGAGPREDECAT